MGEDPGILGVIAGCAFWSAAVIAIPVIIWRLMR